jgi:hypothetical protein
MVGDFMGRKLAYVGIDLDFAGAIPSLARETRFQVAEADRSGVVA